MRGSIIVMILFSLFIACKKEEVKDPGTAVSTKKLDLPADPGTGFDPMTGQPLGVTNAFTLFSLADSSVVSNADSVSLKWDIGFRGSKIILNSGTSGIGTAGGFIYSGLFNDVVKVPADSTFRMDASPTLAIGSAWSTYNPASMILNATPGKVLIIRTANNKYAKMEILSYYKGSPANPNAMTDLPRYYTFRYVLQTNGSTEFK